MERTAKCGRSDEHGAHAYLETNGPRNGHRRWCAGSKTDYSTSRTAPMSPSSLEAIIRERLDEPDATIHDMTDNGGYGLVRWSRPAVWNDVYQVNDREHIVHRWAVRDTADDPIPPLLYNGAYYGSENDARDDYGSRSDGPR